MTAAYVGTLVYLCVLSRPETSKSMYLPEVILDVTSYSLEAITGTGQICLQIDGVAPQFIVKHLIF